MYDHLIKLIIIGNQKVGKSNIMLKLCMNEYEDTHLPTVGVDFYTTIININSEKIKFNIWDTSGELRYKSIVDAYYRSLDIILICFDSSNRKSFDDIPYWFTQITNSNVDNNLIYIVGNKIDLDYSEVSLFELRDIADKYNVNYIEVSAKDNTNINELFIELGIKYLTSNHNKIKKDIIKLETPLLNNIPSSSSCKINKSIQKCNCS